MTVSSCVWFASPPLYSMYPYGSIPLSLLPFLPSFPSLLLSSLLFSSLVCSLLSLVVFVWSFDLSADEFLPEKRKAKGKERELNRIEPSRSESNTNDDDETTIIITVAGIRTFNMALFIGRLAHVHDKAKLEEMFRSKG